LVAVAALVLALMVCAPQAGAISNGVPDGTNHPYVGLVTFQDADGSYLWRCSGTLLSDGLFLTAGHCTEAPAAHAEIFFSAGPIDLDPNFSPVERDCTAPGITGYPCFGDAGGTPYTNPDYRVGNPYGGGNGLPAFSYRDVGVIDLSEAVPTSVVSTYGQLPTAGLVDTLANKTAVDFVGYGVQYQVPGAGNLLPQPPPYYFWTGLRSRMYAPSELVSGRFVHSAEYLRLALNPGGGSGGTCFGDSGGPDLLGGTNTVLGVNSYVTNVNCSGVGYSARVDIPEVLEWIEGFME
jgi:hypothetical protein